MNAEEFSPKLLLIHGNAVGIDFFLRPNQKQYGSFDAFKTAIDDGRAILYNWSKVVGRFGIFKSLNPLDFYRQYYVERQYILSAEAVDKLSGFMSGLNPRIVVAHSLGTNYLLQAVDKYGVPDQVREIHLLHGDFAYDFEFTNTQVIDLLNDGRLKIYNHYLPVDPMLMASWIVNQVMPGGLRPTASRYIQDIRIRKIPNLILHLIANQDKDLAASLLARLN